MILIRKVLGRGEGGDLSRCHFVQHKSHKDWHGIEPWPSPWDTGDKLPEL